MISAGSPGSSCCSPKISIDTMISVGMICSSRWTRKESTPGLLELEADHAHQTVGHLPVALEPVGVRDQHLRVVEVDDRALGQVLGGDLLVGLLAVLELRLRARLGVGRVDFLVAIAVGVLRLAADMEGVGV